MSPSSATSAFKSGVAVLRFGLTVNGEKVVNKPPICTADELRSWRMASDLFLWLDGRTEGSERQKLVEKFNDPSNKRVKCTLISTRAGSLGINLYAANRVIIVDGSWNPTYDLQAIYRAWRYGQTKPVFAYRLMAHGTMEEKIYKRQVTKESLSARVVDRQQVHRTISKEEMLHLFAFGDDENLNTSKTDQTSSNSTPAQSSDEVGGSKQKNPLPHATVSSDKFMEVLLKNIIRGGLLIIMNTSLSYKKTKMKNYQRRNKIWLGKCTVEP
ncbi:protein CHROMATIN REMODELING 20-like [Bidens hawaiensis]|uniref:protein CHROMATIN REMODELING 20-like n=1 Tax=Bidens hawaiensis TaxID=980011 RepID=UPI0040496182